MPSFFKKIAKKIKKFEKNIDILVAVWYTYTCKEVKTMETKIISYSFCYVNMKKDLLMVLYHLVLIVGLVSFLLYVIQIVFL